jgi:phosphate transport system substrate-binding protein
MLFVWLPYPVKTRRLYAFTVIGFAIIITAIFAGRNIYESLIPEAPDEEINLNLYTPFGSYSPDGGGKTLVKSLNEESALKLTENLPRLDGATALYPLYSAFARAAYPESGIYHPYNDLRSDDPEIIATCSKTGGAFQNLIDGYADIVFLMDVSIEQRAAAEEKGLELKLIPIGREAFVFFVNSRNSIANISKNDIVRIYSGKITNWREVGGANDKIIAYQRPDESGSQTALKKVMGGVLLRPAPQEEISNSMMGIYQKVAAYKNYKNSLGYSFLYYIRDMVAENKVKILSIDGIEPTKENIASGAYPLADNFYAVTVQRDGKYLNAERAENAERFIDWIRSPQGRFLVEETGYVPLK